MFAIYQKELKTYFKSFFGWLFLAAFSLFGGIYFAGNNIYYGYPYVSATLQSLVTVLLFILPLLTMRVFADEKKQKTDQMLLTYPINLWSVIAGKFCALATLMLIVIAIVGVGSGIMAIFGTVPLADTLIAMLGFFLFGCICIAVGMFLSSITEHQFIAAILTYAVFMFEMIVPSFLGIFFSPETFIMKAIGIVDIMRPFDLMFASILNLNDVLYIVSAIFLLLFLTYKVFGKNSVQLNAVGRNKFFAGILFTLVVIAAVVGINIGCKYIPDKYTNFDFTKDGWYSITADTKEMIKNLDEDITIYVIGDEDNIDQVLKLYLDAYSSKHINIEYKPTDKYPGFANNYTDAGVSLGSLIVVKGDKYNVVNAENLYETEFNYQTYSYDATGIDIEGQITAAITNLIDDNVYYVYTVFGHGEVDLYPGLRAQIKKGGYELEDLYLLNYTEIPEDCKILVINGPEGDINTDEVKMIEDYYNKGGAIIMSASVDAVDTPNYDKLMEKLTGFNLTNGSVLENEYNNMYQYTPYVLLINPEYTEITSNSYNAGKRSMFYPSRGFYEGDNFDESIYAEKLFITSDSAYEKLLTTEDITQKAEDKTGSFALAVYSEKYISDDTYGKVVAFGTPFFVEESRDQEVAKANSDVFVGAINSMSDKKLVSTIPAKSVDYDFIDVPATFQIVFAAVFIVLLPLICLASGIAIMIIRRKK